MAWCAGRARDRSPTRSSTTTCARCTTTSSSPSSTSPAKHPPTPTSSPTGSAKPSGCSPPPTCSPTPAPPAARLDIDHTDRLRPRRTPPDAEKHWSTPARATSDPSAALHHRIKTHGTWTLRQPFAGIYLWRDPHGQLYLVDHTGTHKITAPGTTSGAATTYDPDIDVVPTDTVIEVEFGRRGS